MELLHTSAPGPHCRPGQRPPPLPPLPWWWWLVVGGGVFFLCMCPVASGEEGHQTPRRCYCHLVSFNQTLGRTPAGWENTIRVHQVSTCENPPESGTTFFIYFFLFCISPVMRMIRTTAQGKQTKKKTIRRGPDDRRLETEVTLRGGRGRRRSRVGGENTSSLGRKKEGKKKRLTTA